MSIKKKKEVRDIAHLKGSGKMEISRSEEDCIEACSVIMTDLACLSTVLP